MNNEERKHEERRFAVLIDADNVSPKYISGIFDELSNEGIVTYKRIYGDWTRPELSPWKSVLLEHSITPIQQYGYTTGKNATDSAMIIDAMDILYTGNVDGFAIVSSDSDFTRLAARLREGGKTVIGMGEKKTPNAFIAACNRFVYLELFSKDSTSKPLESEETLSPETIKKAFAAIVDEISDEDGWASLSKAGNILLKRFPSFDTRSYGFMKLTPFIRSMGNFEIYAVDNKNGRQVIYVRNK